MAVATVTATEYGYSITGGVDATAVGSGTLRVKAMAFSGALDDSVCTLTSKVAGADVSCYKFKSNLTDLDSSATHVWFGENGIPLTGLKVTLGATGSHLYIFLA